MHNFILGFGGDCVNLHHAFNLLWTYFLSRIDLVKRLQRRRFNPDIYPGAKGSIDNGILDEVKSERKAGFEKVHDGSIGEYF